jgi:signal transduction histidine kinase
MAEREPCIEVGRAVRHEPRGAGAGEAAAREALAGVRVHRPTAALVFASVQHDLPDVLRGVRRVLGDVPVIGSSTAGEICDGDFRGGVVVTVLASPHLSVGLGVGENVAGGWSAAVAQALDAPAVRPYFDSSPHAWRRLTQEGKSAFGLVLSPGPTRHAETSSFPIVELVKRRALGQLPLFGMSASDELRFEQNFVLVDDRVIADGLLVAVFETRLRFGIAVAHGMHATGTRLRVTAAHDSEVLELEGRPAADVYAELVGARRDALDGVFVARATRTVVGMPGPLGSFIPNAASYVTPAGGLRFAIPVPVGQVLSRLEPDGDASRTAGPEALSKASARAGTGRPALAVVGCCAIRPLLLGDSVRAEVPTMVGVLGGTPLVGFVSCGEVGLADDGVPQHMNAVISALVVADELSQSALVAQENDELRGRSERLRQERSDELERMVSERTAQLQATNTRLEAEIEERQRRQRAWRALSLCNESLMRAGSESALFQDVCRILVEVGGYRMVWIGLAERDGALRPVAHAGHEHGFLQEHAFSWAEDQPGANGPCGTAIRTGKPVVLRDLRTAPGIEGCREGALRRGYSSVVALPISTEGGPFGTVVLFLSDASALDEAELTLLSDLAGNLGFGVSSLRVREERAHMTTRLVQADRLVSMGTLAAGVGHEINNPLSYATSGLGALSELVSRDLSGPAQAEARSILREVAQGLERIRQAVRDLNLKLFSRLGDDVRHPVEIQPVLESTLHMANNDIRHRARLVREYGATPVVSANESRLGQVFLNLIVNASQSIPDGAADQNEIRVTTSTDARGWAAIEVRDTGSGIAADDLTRIFEPFFTTKSPGEGTGLGLAICRNIVASAGGEISVESERGKGSTFRVFLPPAHPEEAHGEPAPRPAPRPGGARRGRVLVVDDDPLVARSMRRMLAREHDVVIETSARVALSRVHAGEEYDVVLCDVMMPQMSGPEFHGELGRIASRQAARVVFVTGGAFTAGAAAYLEKTGCRVLEKPFEASVLLDLVREFV